MKKILVIFTGGTIGSTEENGLINVDEQKNYRLISMYKKIYHSNVEFETTEIMQILSENITAKQWEALCNFLFSVNFDAYSGIIITHGSDTLAFTSAIIGILFAHTHIPIYLVASNLTLGTPGANGLNNFAMAVEKITSHGAKGVYTAFDRIYPATRIMPADSCLDKFSSYGDIDIKKIFEKASQLSPVPFPFKRIEFKNEILMIYGYPNINFTAFVIPDTVSAVLYVPYHSGTACTDCERSDHTITDFIRRCKERNIPVYLSGIKSTDAIYVTLEKMINAGAIPLVGISEVAAYAKLLIAYNQSSIPISEILEKNIFFEIAE